nr:MAG TPA: hypothetical protein [Caudoviricetes sp.]
MAQAVIERLSHLMMTSGKGRNHFRHVTKMVVGATHRRS